MSVRVLIIEDDEDISMIEKDFLEMEGYEVHIVNDGCVGYHEALTEKYQLEKLRGLGIGADDYISKPFSPTELVARVKANIAQYNRIKRGQQTETVSSEIELGGIRINSQTHRVYVDGIEVDCKHREYELLLFLMENPEIVFSKEQLYEKIWGMEALGNIRTVAVHINRLREKVEEDPTNPQYIQTVWGAGYRFKA